MSITIHEFNGWVQARLPVIAGPRPPGAVSLTTLADLDGHAQLLPLFVALAGGRRQGALTMIHYAVYALTTALVAPLVYDKVALDATSDQLGLVLDATGGMTAVWAGHITQAATDRPLAHIGALAMRLLGPVAEQSRLAARVSARAVTCITLDALSARCRRLANAAGVEPAPGWVAELIAVAEHPEYRLGRVIMAQPDDGPPVEFRVPQYCCVLHTHPDPHACPTCPLHPGDETRLRLINEWLCSLDDADFRQVTGRGRALASSIVS